MNKTRKKIIEMHIAFIIAFTIIGFGCNRETKNQDIQKLSTQKKKPKEDFNNFFGKFGSDSIFQKSRIKFPLSYYSIDIEDNKEERVYDSGDFWYIDFTMDDEASSRNEDKYEPLIKSDTSRPRVTYIRKGIDNGIMIEYIFEIDDQGEWYLVEIVDNSN